VRCCVVASYPLHCCVVCCCRLFYGCLLVLLPVFVVRVCLLRFVVAFYTVAFCTLLVPYVVRLILRTVTLFVLIVVRYRLFTVARALLRFVIVLRTVTACRNVVILPFPLRYCRCRCRLPFVTLRVHVAFTRCC